MLLTAPHDVFLLARYFITTCLTSAPHVAGPVMAPRALRGSVVRVMLVLVFLALTPWLSAHAKSQAGPSPIEISEINANSGMGQRDASFEWFELHNRSAQTWALDGWSIEDNQSSDPLPTMMIPAGGFALIVASTEGRAVLVEGSAPNAIIIVVIDGRIGNGLANSGDRLLLRDAIGNAVDGVSWGDDNSVTDLPSAGAEETLSRVVGERTFRIGAATPGGPTAPLQALPDDPLPLVISEVFADAGLGQADAMGEWIEILNPLAEPVVLERWRIADNTGSDLIPDVTIGGGQRLVIAASAEAALGASLRVIVEDGRIGNGLANGGDEVSLIDPGARVVDRVIYGSGGVPLPEPGRSIARLDGRWVVNGEPSPGRDAVSPLLATLIEGRESDPSSVPVREGGGGDGSIPAWIVVAIGAGAPLAVVTLVRLWGLRRMLPRPRRQGRG